MDRILQGENMPKWFWVKNEGKWIAFDKICHLMLHFIIVKGLCCLGFNPILSFFISAVFGFLYEWLWDCNWVALFTGNAHGASKKDLVANTFGGVIGLLTCLIS